MLAARLESSPTLHTGIRRLCRYNCTLLQTARFFPEECVQKVVQASRWCWLCVNSSHLTYYLIMVTVKSSCGLAFNELLVFLHIQEDSKVIEVRERDIICNQNYNYYCSTLAS